MKYKKQKGASILLTILIMAALLTIAVGISRLSLGEIKLSQDISKTLIAYYAADAGIEAAIYYERASLEGLGNFELSAPECLDVPINKICYTYTIYTDTSVTPNVRFIQSKGFYSGIQRAIELSYELN